ncbi:MAG: hypothetical protein E7613_01165 [Ruminococcaceae bacterium]|nr:hypothetical protein [Oscillospiraceae bacterium]
MQKKSKSAAVTVFFMIVAMLISKLLGMFRGVLLASAYGITEKATAFSAASRIPLSFFDIVFASAILGCFIPVYNSFTGDESKKEQNRFASVYLNFLLLLTGIVALLGIVFAEPLLKIVAPGLLPETLKTAVLLLRIMFPLIVFAAASYTFVGVLQSNGEYIVPAFISAVSNVLIILYFLVFNDRFGIVGLAVSYTVAWLVQLLTLIVPLIKTKYSYRPIFDFKNKGFLTALKLTPSIMMGSWLSPVCMLLSMRFASFTATQGAIPSFEYSINLFTVITGITTYGICNYFFPKLSLEANNDTESFSKTGRNGLISALMMTVPIAAIVFALAPEGISIVYLRGSFDVSSANNVCAILKALVPGMIGFTLVEYLSRLFYALKKPKFVVVSVIFAIIVDFLMLYALLNFTSLDISALGFAYSAGILFAGISMLIFAVKNIKNFLDLTCVFNIFKLIVSGLFSAYAMMQLKRFISTSPYTQGIVLNVLYSCIIAFVGVVVYFLLLFILKEKTVISLIKKDKE